jgi:phosphoribosylanthranilate isomerase
MNEASASRRVRIKFCGFTRAADAEEAIALGVEALGFNFYSKSKRGLAWPEAEKWIGLLSPGPLRVAVMVNPEPALLREICASGIFDLVQFHGDETPEFCSQSELPWMKAVPCPLSVDLEPAHFATRSWLLDAAAPGGQYGGTGQKADWAAAEEFVKLHPDFTIWLAGGLTPENARQAVARVHPSGLDVAGGIESAAGIKCPVKMRQFVEAVRSAGVQPDSAP